MATALKPNSKSLHHISETVLSIHTTIKDNHNTSLINVMAHQNRLLNFYKFYCIFIATFLLAACQNNPGHTLLIHAVAANPATNQLVVLSVNAPQSKTDRLEGLKQLQTFDPVSKRYTWIADLYGNPYALIFDATLGHVLITYDSVVTHHLSTIDLATGIESAIPTSMDYSFYEPKDAVYDPAIDTVFIADRMPYRSNIIAINATSGDLHIFKELRVETTNLALDTSGRRLFVGYSRPGRGLLVIDLESGEQTVLADSDQDIGIGRLINKTIGLTYDETRQKLIATDEHLIFDLNLLDNTGTILFDSIHQPQHSFWSPNTTIFNDKLIVIDGITDSIYSSETLSNYLYAYDLLSGDYAALEQERYEAEKPLHLILELRTLVRSVGSWMSFVLVNILFCRGIPCNPPG